MSIIKTSPKLNHTGGGLLGDWVSGKEYWLCHIGVNSNFEVDTDEPLWIVLSDTPEPGAIAVKKFGKYDNDFICFDGEQQGEEFYAFTKFSEFLDAATKDGKSCWFWLVQEYDA